jgi:hypothetical protein
MKKKNFISKFFSFFAGVVDTADKHSYVYIFAISCLVNVN